MLTGSENPRFRFISLESYTDFPINKSSPDMKYTKINVMSLNIVLNGLGVIISSTGKYTLLQKQSCEKFSHD